MLFYLPFLGKVTAFLDNTVRMTLLDCLLIGLVLTLASVLFVYLRLFLVRAAYRIHLVS